MLDLIQFVLELFTSPVEAIATIVILALIFIGLKWFANRSTSNIPLDEAPEVILRHRLKFVDEDVEYNRSARISPKQMKRLRNEFLILLIVYTVLIGFFSLILPTIWDDMFRGDLDLISIGLLGCIGLAYLIAIGAATFHLSGYVKDLRAKSTIALLSPLVFEEHEGEYMGFKIQTHQYKIIANDPRLPKPLPLHIGFMPRDMWYQVQKLENQTVILYVAPKTSKLLSFELVTTKRDLSQKDVS